MERYKERAGCYPEAVLAAKIYRTRQNLAYCKQRGIRLSGPRLGRPAANQLLKLVEKRIEQQDAAERNAIDRSRRSFGLFVKNWGELVSKS